MSVREAQASITLSKSFPLCRCIKKLATPADPLQLVQSLYTVKCLLLKLLLLLGIFL
jgi:hypothetical protein